jgi:uncharacterized protein YecE (DUF72 family)
MPAPRLLTGTSGFSYKEWKGSFYPEDLPASAMLRFYGERFSTVEINNSFFRVPSESVLRQWADEVPAHFTFAFKAPQQITHRKRLREIDESVAYFSGVVRTLRNRLGPILFQLPPNLKNDIPRLSGLLETLPQDLRVAIEFRHPSWFVDEVFALLRSRDVALCVAHGMEHDTPLVATATWGYLRLRFVEYTRRDLGEWVEFVAQQQWSDAHVYFKHEDTGTGPALAHRFEEMFLETAQG